MPNPHDQNKTILLVYDNPEHCELLEHQFRKMSFDVHTCRSLQTALMMIDACRKLGTSYQWLIVNHSLKDISGHEFIELQDRQRRDQFDIIYFHRSIHHDNLARLSGVGSHIIPLSDRISFSAFTEAIGKIIKRRQQLEELAREPAAFHRQPKILLVEDNDIGRLMARTLLENIGLEVTEVVNGKDALDQISQADYDLVLTDILMPVMNGLDMIRSVRSSGHYDLPIIVMSANAETSWAESFSAGANGYLVKPFDSTKLHQELQKWIVLPRQNDMNVDIPGTGTSLFDLTALQEFVDIQTGISMAGGKRDNYRNMLQQYVASFSGIIDELQRFIATGDLSQAVHAAHTLRGVAGGLGACRIQDLAGQLERELATSGTASYLADLGQEHQKLVRAIRSLPDPELRARESGPAGQLPDLVALLVNLREQVEEHRAKAVTAAADRLKSRRWPESVSSQVDRLLKELEVFQYDTASRLIAEILERHSHES